MANKRMFTMKIVDSDAFLDMPLTSQCLYFHLNMRADDDGFIGNPKRISKLIGCNDDDLKLLVAKRFVIAFEDGVIVIKHWRMHNTLSTNRYSETQYLEEKSTLLIKENGSYSLSSGVPLDDTKKIETSQRQVRRTIDATKTHADIDIDKELDKGKEEDIKSTRTPKHKYGEYSNVLLTEDEYNKLYTQYGNAGELITFLDEYIEMKGYKAKSHYLAILKWVVDAVNERKHKAHKGMPEGSTNPFLNALLEGEIK